MYQPIDIGGSSGGTAALAFDAPFRTAPRPLFGQKRAPARRSVGDFDLVVDLGQRIGSAEWLGGFVTCAALCYSAWSLCAPVAPLPGISPPSLSEPQLEQVQALGFAPLALGADSGRRMAPTAAVEALPESPERPIIDLRASLGRGDGLARVLERAGTASPTSDRAP